MLRKENIFENRLHINYLCFLFQDHVYVYDGIPKFIDSEGTGILIGSYCGTYTGQFRPVIATSGIITVYFDADIGSNCKFSIISCRI